MEGTVSKYLIKKRAFWASVLGDKGNAALLGPILRACAVSLLNTQYTAPFMLCRDKILGAPQGLDG